MDNEITKAPNTWQSLSNPSTGANLWYTPVAQDLQLLSLYVNSDVVHACIEINAQAVASTYLGLYTLPAATNNTKKYQLKVKGANKKKYIKSRHRKDMQSDDAEPVEILKHPLLDLISNDDDDLDDKDLLRLTVIYLQVFGRAYWQLVRDGISGVPTAIRLLQPWNLLPMRDAFGNVIYYQYQNIYGNGTIQKVELQKDEVLDFRWPSPSDPYAGGDSPLRAAFNKISLSSKFLEWQNNILNNRQRPDWLYIPKVDAELSPDEQKRIETQLYQKLKDNNNGKVVVGSHAGTVTPLNWNPTDLAALQIDEEMQKALMFALHIPEAFSNNDGNRANLEGSLEQWARQAVFPLCDMLERKLNKLADVFSEDIFFCFDNPVPEDEEFELQEQTAAAQLWNLVVPAVQAGIATVEEARLELGLPETPEVGSLDDEPEPQEAEQPAPVAPAATPAPQAEPTATEPPQEPQKGLDVSTLLSINAAVASGQLDRATAINIIAKTFDLTDNEAKSFIGHFKDQTADTSCKCSGCLTSNGRASAKAARSLPKLSEPKTNPKLVAAAKKMYGQMADHYLAQIKSNKNLFDRLEAKSALPDKFVPLDDWDAELQFDSKPVIEFEMQKAANGRIKSYQRLGASADVFEVVPQYITEAVDNATLNFARSTIQTTTKNVNDALGQLREELKAGLEEGEAIPKLRDRVQEIFENCDSERAELVAHTETSRAVHEGQRIAAKASGIVKGFKLLLSSDACELCQSVEVENSEIGLDDKFNEGDDYDDSALPIHPACRCTMMEVLDLDALNAQDN